MSEENEKKEAPAVEEKKDDEDADGDDCQQPSPCLQFILVLTAPRNVRAGRKSYVLADDPLGFLDKIDNSD